ncbi:MAG: tetratricopeptide repeat protein [Burkholderiales bacterium]
MSAPRGDGNQLDQAKKLFQEGLAAQQTGMWNVAEEKYRCALVLVPGRSSIVCNLGVLLLQQQRADEALGLCEQLVFTEPENTVALTLMGNCLAMLGRSEQALTAFERALACRPQLADTFSGRGNLLMNMGRIEEALGDYDEALRIQPKGVGENYNRARALSLLGRQQEALQAYSSVLAMQPDYVSAWNNMANIHYDLGRDAEAAECFSQVISLDPNHAKAHTGLGLVRQEQWRLDDAARQYELALAADRNAAEAHHNRAILRLFRMQLDDTWPDYEYRICSSQARKTLRPTAASLEQFTAMPRWRGPGEVVEGGVGIWSEQGIGDQVLFSTLLPELLTVDGSFIYEVDRRLLGAYQRAYPRCRFVALQEPAAEELRTAGAALLAGSLPGLLRGKKESFVRQPRRLLGALPERVAHYRDRLGTGLKVALSWRSTRAGRLGRSKSATLAQFAPLFGISGARFVDVQYGDTAAERTALAREHGAQIVHFDEVDCYNDLEEVLAILEACDLLITTSNANAHFAGALGKPVWLLYPSERAPFHYWAHGGDHRCLWYPSVEIISGPELTDWKLLVKHAAEKLAAAVADNRRRD